MTLFALSRKCYEVCHVGRVISIGPPFTTPTPSLLEESSPSPPPRPSSTPPNCWRKAILHGIALQYADFSQWQREAFQQGAWADQMSYWRQQLNGDLHPLQLPRGRPRPAIRSFRAGFQPLALSKSVAEALKTLAAGEGATLFAMLFAVFAVLLHRYTQEDDIVIGSIAEGRNRPEVQGLLDRFLNPFVLRADLSGDPNFQEFVRRAHEITVGALANIATCPLNFL